MRAKRALLQRLVLPGAARLSPFDSWARMEAMVAADRDSATTRDARRLDALAALTAHAAAQTRHYADLLAPIGLVDAPLRSLEDFERIPVTTKADLRRGFPDRQVAASHRDRWLRYSNTSGTTGRPLVLVQDVHDISAKYASKLWSRRVAGVEPVGRVTRMTPNECQPCLPCGERQGAVKALLAGHSAGLFVWIEDGVVNRVFHDRWMLPPLLHDGRPPSAEVLDRCLEDIERSAPDLLVIYPLFALLLARHIRTTGRTPPRLPGILDFSGGLITPAMRAIVEAAFERRSVQCCGGCEFARYGGSCPEDPDRMHLAETHAYVEVLASDGSPAAPEALGNVVVTSLHSRALPVLRLEPGDVARLITTPCTCGRSSRRLQHEGRLQALLRNAEGRWVTAREVWDTLLPIPGVALFQLRQRSTTTYDLDLLSTPGQSTDRDRLDAALAGLLGVHAQVHIEPVDRILPEGSGKLQLVKSCTFEDFRVPSARRDAVPVN